MDQTIKLQWADELRSGKYTQGTTTLRSYDDSFCCLGVLCDMAVKAGVVVEHHSDGDESWSYGEDPNRSLLPEEVVLWAGLPDSDPEVDFGDEFETRCLSDINDGGASFAEIADIIEGQL